MRAVSEISDPDPSCFLNQAVNMLINAVKVRYFWPRGYVTSGLSAASLKRNLNELQLFALPYRLHFFKPDIAPWSITDTFG